VEVAPKRANHRHERSSCPPAGFELANAADFVRHSANGPGTARTRCHIPLLRARATPFAGDVVFLLACVASPSVASRPARAERRLADDVMGEHWIGRMKLAAAHVGGAALTRST